MGKRSTRQRAVWLGVVIFAVSVLVLLGGAGVYLALHPEVGGWRGVKPPPLMNLWGTMSADLGLVRVSNGVSFGPRPDESSERLPAGITLLGRVDFAISQKHFGWPRRTRSEWSVTLNSVEPASGAPSASDERAWRMLLAEACSKRDIALNRPVPAGLLRGEAQGSETYVGAFALNMADRLWHAPAWSGACVGAAAVLGVGAGLVAWWRNKRPGACGKCGYDLAGLAGEVCPECGAAIGSGARSEPGPE